MTTATQLTVSDAALQVGVTRQTIFKAIKSGKLSATQNNRGHMQINVVELLRVYGELQSPDQVAKNKVNSTQQSRVLPASAGLQLELERMKLLIERKDFELEHMRERVAELKTREQQANEERLRVFGLLEQQTRLLAAPAPVAVTKPKAATKRAAKPAVKAKAITPAKKSTTTRKTPAALVKPVAKVATRKKAAVKPAAKKVVKKSTRK
jgi:excisionase family DNA binding protein